MRIQAQRIALGTFKAPGGQEIQVYMTREWYRQFEEIAKAVNPGADDGDSDDEGIGPPDRFGADTEGGDAAGVADEPIGVTAAVHGLEEAVWALETDALVSQLQAQVEALQERIAALEQGGIE